MTKRRVKNDPLKAQLDLAYGAMSNAGRLFLVELALNAAKENPRPAEEDLDELIPMLFSRSVYFASNTTGMSGMSSALRMLQKDDGIDCVIKWEDLPGQMLLMSAKHHRAQWQ